MSIATFHHIAFVAPLLAAQENRYPRRILVIDDSLTVCKILEICLRREGFVAACFTDGLTALHWLFSPGIAPPDLIILDLFLPRMNGFAVARRLRNQPLLRQTPLIMLTRYDGTLNRLKGRLVGVQEYLTKPFKTEDILAVVKRYLHDPCPPTPDNQAVCGDS